MCEPVPDDPLDAAIAEQWKTNKAAAVQTGALGGATIWFPATCTQPSRPRGPRSHAAAANRTVFSLPSHSKRLDPEVCQVSGGVAVVPKTPYATPRSLPTMNDSSHESWALGDAGLLNMYTFGGALRQPGVGKKKRCLEK